MELFGDTPLVMTIKILHGSNLKGSKPAPNTFVRVQFADFEFKDTAIVNDNQNPQYNTEFQQSFIVDENLINIFTSKTINFTLNEALPKEKTAVLGSCEISLFKKFLYYYERSNVTIPDCPLTFTQTLPISYMNAKLLVAGQEPPVVTFSVTLSRPLLAKSVLQSSTFLSIELEEVSPVPEGWNFKDGNEKDPQSNLYHYCASIKFPGSGEESKSFVMGGGVLGMIEDLNSQDLVHNLPQTISTIETKSVAEIDTKDSDSKVFKQSSEKCCVMKGVKWNSVYNIWLGPRVLDKLRSKSNKTLELEVIDDFMKFYRVPQPKFSGFADAAGQRCKAIVLIDFQSCLNPTVIGLKGRYNLESTDFVAEGKKFDPYKAVGSTISLKLMFSAPLISKKTLSEISKSVQEYIPKRNVTGEKSHSQRTASASHEYKVKIKELVNHLINEYREALKLELTLDTSSKGLLQTQSRQDEELRKRLFLYHLNKSGAYFEMKEKLKSAVTQIVREKFQLKSPFDAKSDLRLFLGEVYVYLLEEMHTAISAIFDNKLDYSDEELTLKKLKTFAEEAECIHDIEKAAKYHRERIAKCEEDLSCWFDYSTFCLRNHFDEIGVEALKEIIGRDDKHFEALLAYAMICFASENYEETRSFLQQAINVDPRNIVVNCMMGIFLDALNDIAESNVYLNQAEKLCSENSSVKTSQYIKTADFAIKINCGVVADKVLALEILKNPISPEPHLLFARLEVQRGRLNKAESILSKILLTNKLDVNAWIALGHLLYMQKRFSEAKVVYDKVLSFSDVSNNKLELVYIRLGDIYLEMAWSASKQSDPGFDSYARLSKSMYLTACVENKGRHQSWIGAAKACFILEEYEQAEDAFCEANFINNKDGDIWANIALLCLTVGRLVEAEQAIAQALRLGVKDAELLRLNCKLFLESERPQPILKLAKDIQDQELQLQYKKALAMVAKSKLDEKDTRVSGLAI